MIPLSDQTWQSQPWQWLLANAIHDPVTLANILQLDVATLGIKDANIDFPMHVPHPYLSRIQPGNPDDPLLRQVLPLGAEDEDPPGYVIDPLQENQYLAAPGLIQKYDGRALVVSTGRCGIHCRYCFRKKFPYSEQQPSRQDWQEIIKYVYDRPDLSELIISGGDPLILGDRQLDWILKKLTSIPQLTTVRFHSRMPVVIPQRVTRELVEILSNSSLQIVMVIHANHAQEFDADVDEALHRLRLGGIHLLNQSVLLAKINDNTRTLTELSRRLLKAGTLPYYLHLLDPVSGTSHFDVPLERAQQLHNELVALLPGYLVPKLVREIPGQLSKSPMSLPLSGV